jgi:hypothetical protein
MSLISQHSTVYNTAKILALLCLVLLNSQKVGFALSYWDAIFEIGFNPDTARIDSQAACRQIERLIKFRNAIHEKPVFDEKLDTEIRKVESRISSLDAGNLYNQLPYSDNIGVWRGIGIRGGLDDDHYQLSIIDPDIENWVNSYSRDIPERWGPQKNFGDFGLRAFIRPASNNSFRFETEGQLYIDNLNSSNMMRIVKQLVNAAWVLARDGEHPPNEFFKGSALNDRSLRVLYGLAKDFPRLFAIFNQYFTIENIVSEEAAESTGPITFDIVIRININAIKKEYPYLGALFDRLKGMLNYQKTLFDAQNRPLGTLAFDGDKYLLSTRFKTQKGRFMILTENSSKAKESGVDLTVSGHQRFYMVHSFRLNIAGLKLNIEALKVNLDYYHDDNTANVTAELQQTPQEITAGGLILGFLPIWLIDFFIPSNIEDMTQEFFQTLASGNNGEGFSIMYGSIPQESLAGNLWLLTDGEVMSNGTIKFGFNLQRQMVRNKDKLLEDIRVFAQQLWKAFYLDFLRIKLLKYCR